MSRTFKEKLLESGIGDYAAELISDPGSNGSNIVTAKVNNLTGRITLQAGSVSPLQRLGRKPKTTVVATRSAIPFFNTFGTAKQFMSRVGYHMLDEVTTFTLVFVNWSSNGNAEAAGASSATVKATIEYPLGTIAATVTFSGSATGTMAAGGQIESDPILLTIPAFGRFAVRCFLDAPAGAPYFLDGPGALSSIVDSSSFGATATDVTSSMTAIANTQGGIHYRPSLIKGQTSLPVALLIGDSRVAGINDFASDAFGAVGELARSFSPAIGVLNMGSPGASVGSFVAGGVNWSKRMAFVSGLCDFAISNLGINDIVSGVSDTATTANVSNIQTVIGLKTWQCTIPPKTTSSDSWATLANQTLDAYNTNRVNFNNAVRCGLKNISGHIEIADYVESARNSGKWRVDGTTANLWTNDGLHESQYANMQIDMTPSAKLLLSTWTAF